jgi:hypothetical protein
LKKFINEKDYELEKLITANSRLEDDIKHLTEKLAHSEKSCIDEYDRKFEDLKSIYAEQIDQQKRLYQGT